MKPYASKGRGTTRGLKRSSGTAKAQRVVKRCLKRDKAAARREGAVQCEPGDYSSSAGYGGWGHDE